MKVSQLKDRFDAIFWNLSILLFDPVYGLLLQMSTESLLLLLLDVPCVFFILCGSAGLPREDLQSMIACLSFLPLISAFYVLGTLLFHQGICTQACLSC